MNQVRMQISRPLQDPEWRRRSRSVELNQDRFETPTSPMTLAGLDSDWAAHSRHNALPFADGSIGAIAIEAVLEYVRDDLALVQELNRVIKPGGSLRLRVPNAGLLAGLDGFNLYRYVADITHRGVTIPEVREVGFRRHYAVKDLEQVLGTAFRIERTWTTGTALSELAHVGTLAVTTLIRFDPERYVAARPRLNALTRLDGRIPMGAVGFWRWIEARRV